MAVYNYVTESGVIVPDTSSTRQEVITEYRAAIGDDLIVDDETPEGVLINAETTSRQSVARNNAALANQINPNLAGGPFLDSIWSLTGGQRIASTRSTVNATITGIANTAIPQGSRAATEDGDEFETVNPVVIPVSGTLENVPFQSVEAGSIGAGTGQLTNIIDGVLGWETVTNPAAATPGRQTESDEASRNRRRVTLGRQGRSVAEAVSSNVLTVPGVRSLVFRENITNQTATIDGISLKPHSVIAIVDGGADMDIAAALLRSKTAGSDWNGSQSVTVTEPFSGQNYPVLFDRPTVTAVAIRATVRRTSAVSDPITTTRQSILRYSQGLIEGEPGFVVGHDVSPV